jgi:hypothetical protein
MKTVLVEWWVLGFAAVVIVAALYLSWSSTQYYRAAVDAYAARCAVVPWHP